VRQKKKVDPPKKKETHGAIWFECQSCGKRWRMWLEKGIEDKRFRRIYPEKHKTIPDTIKCQCGGSAEHVDWQKDLKLKNYRVLLPNMNQFAYDENEEYGIPVLRKEVANVARQQG
jgi:hypothetical protein